MEGVGRGVPSGFASSMQRDASSSLPPSATCVRKGLPQRPRHLWKKGEAAILGLFAWQGAVLHPSQEKKSGDSRWRGRQLPGTCTATIGHQVLGGLPGESMVPQKVAGLRDTEGHIMRGSIYVKYLEQANSLKAD